MSPEDLLLELLQLSDTYVRKIDGLRVLQLSAGKAGVVGIKASLLCWELGATVVLTEMPDSKQLRQLVANIQATTTAAQGDAAVANIEQRLFVREHVWGCFESMSGLLRCGGAKNTADASKFHIILCSDCVDLTCESGHKPFLESIKQALNPGTPGTGGVAMVTCVLPTSNQSAESRILQSFLKRAGSSGFDCRCIDKRPGVMQRHLLYEVRCYQLQLDPYHASTENSIRNPSNQTKSGTYCATAKPKDSTIFPSEPRPPPLPPAVCEKMVTEIMTVVGMMTPPTGHINTGHMNTGHMNTGGVGAAGEGAAGVGAESYGAVLDIAAIVRNVKLEQKQTGVLAKGEGSGAGYAGGSGDGASGAGGADGASGALTSSLPGWGWAMDVRRELYDALFEGYDSATGKRISRAERQAKGLKGASSLVYGEIAFEPFALTVLKIKDIYGALQSPGGRFYDVGAGTAKPVFAAAMLHEWELVGGVEILEGLHATSKVVLQRWRAMGQVLQKQTSGTCGTAEKRALENVTVAEATKCNQDAFLEADTEEVKEGEGAKEKKECEGAETDSVAPITGIITRCARLAMTLLHEQLEQEKSEAREENESSSGGGGSSSSGGGDGGGSGSRSAGGDAKNGTGEGAGGVAGSSAGSSAGAGGDSIGRVRIGHDWEQAVEKAVLQTQEGRHEQAKVRPLVLSQLLQTEVQLVCGDATSLDALDWSDGDLVLMNSTCFDTPLLKELSICAERLRKGTFVITFTRPLISNCFTILDKQLYKMSWGAATVFIHQRNARKSRAKEDADMRAAMGL
jgi:hypothetical protein